MFIYQNIAVQLFQNVYFKHYKIKMFSVHPTFKILKMSNIFFNIIEYNFYLIKIIFVKKKFMCIVTYNIHIHTSIGMLI